MICVQTMLQFSICFWNSETLYAICILLSACILITSLQFLNLLGGGGRTTFDWLKVWMTLYYLSVSWNLRIANSMKLKNAQKKNHYFLNQSYTSPIQMLPSKENWTLEANRIRCFSWWVRFNPFLSSYLLHTHWSKQKKLLDFFDFLISWLLLFWGRFLTIGKQP